MLFFEGYDDYKILRRFARQLGLTELSTGNDITAFESGGFSQWHKVKAFAWGFKETLNKPLHIGAIFDRDFWSSEELTDIQVELNEHLELAHIHTKKEIENYLLDPEVLEKALRKSIKEREKRTGVEIAEAESVYQILDRITGPLKNELQGQYIAKRTEFLKKKYPGIDSATIATETLRIFEKKWGDLKSRMDIVSGKTTLKLLRDEVQKIYSVSLTDFKIIDEFTTREIPEDLRDLLFKMEEFRTRK